MILFTVRSISSESLLRADKIWLESNQKKYNTLSGVEHFNELFFWIKTFWDNFVWKKFIFIHMHIISSLPIFKETVAGKLG